MRIDILTLFPEMFNGPFSSSIVARAQQKGLAEIHLHDFRAHGLGRHRAVDDTPYGGGGGMLLRPEPIFAAVEELCPPGEPKPLVVLLTPQGETLTQETVRQLGEREHLILICGHYEGFDERIRTGLADREVSIGDYVLTGGELPAMVLVDAIVRTLPGVLGAEDGAENDSFARGILDYPQYTRPVEFRGERVPEILQSGDHARIAAWRREQALLRTARRRPDLLAGAGLSSEERMLLRAQGLWPDALMAGGKEEQE
ncbi:MAG: tRNA (guanosine(37)-N1)-methyltransferase TrmD [Bacteroidota bacterium]